jgi:unsaturated chondroitin disaccharide hydrolase
MLHIDFDLDGKSLKDLLDSFWKRSGDKIRLIETQYDSTKGAPVFTIDGKYTSKGWTEWTQGFQYGSALLQFDATGEAEFLKIGRDNTLQKMAPHLTNTGVHDHGFNNLSTYGNLLRLMHEGKIPFNEWEQNFYRLALKVSGAVQANRWTNIEDGGFMYSFNGPHSLFVDTIRSCRVLMTSHLLGHRLYVENDQAVNLLERAIQHLQATAKYAIYYGEGRDRFDVRGRTAHESIFNTNDGHYRCPNAQQGYTGLSTWTRGLAWAMCGFSEELEFIATLDENEFEGLIPKNEIIQLATKAARTTCDFYLENVPVDGIPYWDTGAPNLHRLGDYKNQPSDPYNAFEPVDSSAAAIGAQGLLRLGTYLKGINQHDDGTKYYQAGLTILKHLLEPPYTSNNPEHQGLLLHSIYHYPNGWDSIPEGYKVPCNNSSMWGDYHLREIALMVQKNLKNESNYNFFSAVL